MSTYHFIAKVPLTAYTTIEANSYEEALEEATSEDRGITYELDSSAAKYLMQTMWVIREIDEGPEDIHLRTVNPITS